MAAMVVLMVWPWVVVVVARRPLRRCYESSRLFGAGWRDIKASIGEEEGRWREWRRWWRAEIRTAWIWFA